MPIDISEPLLDAGHIGHGFETGNHRDDFLDRGLRKAPDGAVSELLDDFGWSQRIFGIAMRSSTVDR